MATRKRTKQGDTKQRKITAKENPFLYEQREGESLEHFYRRLAKTADQRLVRLEKLAKEEAYKSVNKYAYARAMRDIKQWAGEGATRFNTSPPKHKAKLKAKIRDMKTFLEAPTSTKQGVESVYQNRADILNEKYGTNFEWKDLANYFEQAKASKSDEEYGSKTMLKALGVIQKNAETVVKQIEQHKKKHLTIPDAGPRLQEAIDSMLADRKLKLNDLL